MQRAKLQLVGVTCMLIAAKYEEIYAPQAGYCQPGGPCQPCASLRLARRPARRSASAAPQVDEFCYITDNTYDRSQVLGMEREARRRRRRRRSEAPPRAAAALRLKAATAPPTSSPRGALCL